MDTKALIMLYLIIGINCVVVEFEQYRGCQSIIIPTIFISILIWPLLIIADIRHFRVTPPDRFPLDH